MQGKRIDRVADLIHKELGNAIATRLRDPRIGFVTITRVNVSADLHYAKVFYSVIGDGAKRKATQEALNHAKGFLQKDLAQVLNLRYTPHLEFYLDDSIERSIEIEGLLKSIHQEEGSRIDNKNEK